MADFEKLRQILKDLPVASILEEVINDVIKGKVTIVAASTNSGKSMLLPGALVDKAGELVAVLVPRRFLAIDAAYNVAELSGTPVGDKVGYALGHIDGESSQRSAETNLLYCTYGYALNSGLINKARAVVLDEVHEADEHISLTRAILRERKKKDSGLLLLEMSATVDAKAQARYWEDISSTAIHSIPSKTLACDVIHESPLLAGNAGRSAEQITLALLKQGRKGIVLFRPGVREVEDSVAEIIKQLDDLDIKDVETIGIHGGTPSDERRVARKQPESGYRKIIVGTNVIESGVNLRWLDAGVSDGFRKIPYDRDDTGATALVVEEQPQAGLLQQMGRINRDPLSTGFERGLFVLHAKKNLEARKLQNGPAIQRQSLRNIAFHAASLGYDPTKLTWDIMNQAHQSVLKSRLELAKKELIQLELLNEDWSLTDDGIFISRLPVSPESGAIISEAKRLDEMLMRNGKEPRVMRDIVIVVAILESHGLRLDGKKGHKADQHRTSDLLDSMNAYRSIRKERIAQTVIEATELFLAHASEEELIILQMERSELKLLCEMQNISLQGFIEVAKLVDEITNRLSKYNKGIRIDLRDADDRYDAERYAEIQRCIINGYVNRLFMYEHGGLRDLLRDFGKQRSEAGRPFNGYAVSKFSIVKCKEGDLVVGNLRELPVFKGEGYLIPLVLTDLTYIPVSVFIDWSKGREARYQKVLSHVLPNSEGKINVGYLGLTSFELTISPQEQKEIMSIENLE